MEKWADHLMKSTQVQARICNIEWELPVKKIISKIQYSPCRQVARINVLTVEILLPLREINFIL